MTRMIQSLTIAAIGLVPLSSALGQCEIFRTTGTPDDAVGLGVGVHGDWMVYTQRRTVHVMRWTGASWAPDEVLSLPEVVYAVDVYGDVIVAGVIGDPMTINIFRHNGSDWVLETTIEDRGFPNYDGGRSLDLHGDVLITCNPWDGGAWIFRYGNGQWKQEYESAGFFAAVATNGTRCILGLIHQQAAFSILIHDGSEWVQEIGRPTFNAGSDQVDISGQLALVGSESRGMEVFRDCGSEPYCCTGNHCVDEYFGDSLAAAISGDEIALLRANDIALFRDNSGSWDVVDILSATGANDPIGRVVETDGESVVVGAPEDNAGGERSGSVFVFRRNAKYVDRSHTGGENGTCRSPYNTLEEGRSATPASGLLVLAAGTYAEAPLTIGTPIKITTSAGTARIE